MSEEQNLWCQEDQSASCHPKAFLHFLHSNRILVEHIASQTVATVASLPCS